MADSTRLRWAIWAVVLLVTGVACLLPIEDEPAGHAERARRPSRVALKGAVPLTPLSPPIEGVDVDPFAPRAWQAAVVPPTVAVAPSPVPTLVGPMPPPPPAPPPAPPPPLPFQFMGRLSDGTAPVIYLNHGDQTLVARAGDTIDQTYKVVSISPVQMEFLHMPTGEKQLMSLPVTDN